MKKTILKNAVNAAKRNEKKWLENGKNSEFRVMIEIFENGYRTSLTHTAAYPAFRSWKEMGNINNDELLYVQYFSTTIYNSNTNEIVDYIEDCYACCK